MMTTYSDDLGARICAELAKGRTLRAICEADGMPAESTIRSWAIDLDHPFSAQYARAREVGYHIMADELLDIADGKSVAWNDRDADIEDKVSDRDGATAQAAIQRDRLRVDTRKWLLSKALPKIYGDKVTQEHTGKDGAPIGHAIEVTFVGKANPNEG